MSCEAEETRVSGAGARDVSGPAPEGLGASAQRAGVPAACLLVVGLVAVAWRLALAPGAPAAFDEVSFLAALERYDLLSFEPHFPGYPLTVLLARLLAAAGAARPYAALSGLALLVALPALFRLAGGGWRGAWAGALFAWAPLAAREGLRPMADTLATCLVVAGAALLLDARRARLGPARLGPARLGAGRLGAGALLLGAAAAAKPDVALFLALLLLPCARAARPGRAAGIAALALAPWVAFGALALVEGCGGVERAWHEGLRFVSGHLGDWGGLDRSAPRALFACAPLGDLGPDAVAARLAGVVLLAALALRAPRALRRAALIGAGPYGLWLLFGQNLAHPRHALPLLPFLLVLAARGLPARGARGRRAALAAGALALVAVASTLVRAPAWREGGRPVDRLAEWLAAQPLEARLYAGSAARALRWRLPARDVRRARDAAHLRADLAADPSPPALVFATDEVLAGAAEPGVPPIGLRAEGAQARDTPAPETTMARRRSP
ncbi:MAG: hypothetical protein AB7N76_27535 [Planctomycetota bacterium]